MEPRTAEEEKLEPPRVMPLIGGPTGLFDERVNGNQPDNRLGPAGNDNLLTPQGPVDEVQQMRPGESDSDDCHVSGLVSTTASLTRTLESVA